MKYYRLIPIGFIIFIILLDQLSKKIILWADASERLPINIMAYFDLILVYNPGISFSMFASSGAVGRYLLIIVALLVSIFFFRMLLKSHNLWYNMALALIISGAIGNMLDRIFYGKVVDFLYFHVKNFHFPVFNLADSAITVGGILFFLLSIKGSEHEIKK